MLNSRCKNHHPLCWLFKRSWIHAVVLSYLLLAALPSDARALDVCKLAPPQAKQELVKGAVVIAKAYENGSSQKLVGGPCDWTCGNMSFITPFKKAFGFLQYNCKRDNLHQMGLSITDVEYRNMTNKVFRSGPTGVGDLMQVPFWLENASKNGDVKQLTDVVDKIFAVEKTRGPTWLKFSSTSVDNDGQGADRVLINVPDTKQPARFEQWIQIAIDKRTGTLGRNVDFLALQLVSDSSPSQPLATPVAAFRGFSRTSAGFKLEGAGSSPLSTCYSCHPNGLRTVFPATPGTKAAGGSIAIKPEGTMMNPFNMLPLKLELKHIERITSKRAVFGPAGYQASDNGPPLGPSSWLNRKERVTQGLPALPPLRPAVPACAAGLTGDRQQTIMNKMTCTNCHGRVRSVLNAGTSFTTNRHKVIQNVEAPMPPPHSPTNSLTDVEREALFKCVMAEYAEMLYEWLIS